MSHTESFLHSPEEDILVSLRPTLAAFTVSTETFLGVKPWLLVNI